MYSARIEDVSHNNFCGPHRIIGKIDSFSVHGMKLSGSQLFTRWRSTVVDPTIVDLFLVQVCPTSLWQNTINGRLHFEVKQGFLDRPLFSSSPGTLRQDLSIRLMPGNCYRRIQHSHQPHTQHSTSLNAITVTFPHSLCYHCRLASYCKLAATFTPINGMTRRQTPCEHLSSERTTAQ